jgi:hypothetical protein
MRSLNEIDITLRYKTAINYRETVHYLSEISSQEIPMKFSREYGNCA